ncbi:Pseudouridine-5'-phosphatase at N-terminal half [Coccomyxa sp. Obi]|nr:Pseudouridine-5'-phosphatase at N-terminal half [Coccomyxa sp. Obi]
MHTVKAVILDLDGTLLDTESMVLDVTRSVLQKYGHKITAEVQKSAIGRKPLDAWQATIDQLHMQNVTAQQLFDESENYLKSRWQDARLMPGAARLLWHLHSHGIPLALATSTPRATFERKMSGKAAQALTAVFQTTKCGDEVEHGKPAPDCFRATAKKMGVAAEECLVIEDAPSGVQAATAAGMRVVVVPSLRDLEAYPKPDPDCSSGCCAVLPSLFDFRPELYGLPPFEDAICGEVVPIQPPWRIKGTVVKGFGRGSRELGIPTANLDSESLQSALAETVSGVYCGWASIGKSPEVYKTAMSIGWNPYYKNEEKTAEPWLLHDFDRDFYGEELRVLVSGYIRPEANFSSLEALIARIHKDADVTREALEYKNMAQLKNDPFLRAQ